MSHCFDCFYFASNAKGRYCALNGQTVRRTDSCNAHFPKKNVQWCSMCNSRTTHDTGSCPDLASTNTNHEPQRPMAKKKKGKGGKKGGKRC